MAVRRLANTPIKKLSIFEAEWPKKPPGWYCKIRNKWHKVPRRQKTNIFKLINSGKVVDNDVAILRFSDIEEGLVSTVAYHRGFWYQITGETQSLDNEEVEVLVRQRHEKIRRDVERAKDEPFKENLHKDKNNNRRKSIPKSVQREVWRRDGGACIACGSKERLEYDHIIPHSKGGANTARNIQLLCEVCNRRKSNQVGG